MSGATDRECILGVERCGCITYANARPDDLNRDDQRAISRIIASGGRIDRMTVEEARAQPHFLPIECPHDPKGWKREKPKEPDPIRYRRPIGRRNVSIVYAKVSRWKQSGLRAGEVTKFGGKWWATEGWIQANTVDGKPVATDGAEPRGPSEVFGPFAKQREAAEFLVPLAERRGEELIKKWGGGER